MSYRDQRSVGELAAIYVIFTLCLCFAGWIGTALYRWSNAPYVPPKPSAFELSVQSCRDQGGTPYTKWIKMDGYAPKEQLERCEKPEQKQAQ